LKIFNSFKDKGTYFFKIKKAKIREINEEIDVIRLEAKYEY
jgi:hypothetical protein